MAHQLEILELLQQLNVTEKRTIVMVLHDLNHAARFADYIIGMKFGKIVKSGLSEEIITKPVLRELFQIDAEIGEDPRTGKPICITYNLVRGD
jgi:iron complex transport system ATP-binding protein